MKTDPILWLRISFQVGAILDVVAGLVMVFPGLFAILNRPENFQPEFDYRYAMGMGAPLMFGWTILLLWADRKPLERKGILPITLLVIAGEMATQVWGISAGVVLFGALLPTFIIQLLLTMLFLFSYFNARKMT